MRRLPKPSAGSIPGVIHTNDIIQVLHERPAHVAAANVVDVDDEALTDGERRKLWEDFRNAPRVCCAGDKCSTILSVYRNDGDLCAPCSLVKREAEFDAYEASLITETGERRTQAQIQEDLAALRAADARRSYDRVLDAIKSDAPGTFTRGMVGKLLPVHTATLRVILQRAVNEGVIRECEVKNGIKGHRLKRYELLA